MSNTPNTCGYTTLHIKGASVLYAVLAVAAFATEPPLAVVRYAESAILRVVVSDSVSTLFLASDAPYAPENLAYFTRVTIPKS